jgi:membrane protein insertase Oxa1/YidC/SpoIIIJ
VISLSIPAGVVVYFIVSNVWQIGQQAVMFRNQPLAASAAGGALAAKQPQSQPPAKQAQPQPPAKPKPTPRSSRRNRRRGR